MTIATVVVGALVLLLDASQVVPVSVTPQEKPQPRPAESLQGGSPIGDEASVAKEQRTMASPTAATLLVLDAERRTPIGGLRVELAEPGMPGLEPRSVLAVSDADGEIVLPDLCRASPWLVASKDELERALSADSYPVAEPGDRFTAWFSSATVARGRVIREDGAPAVNVPIRAILLDESPSAVDRLVAQLNRSLQRFAATDAWGFYRLGGLEVGGEITIFAGAAQQVPTVLRTIVPADGVLADLTLRSGAVTSVLVVDADTGVPIPGATVTIEAGDSGAELRATSDENGRARFEGIEQSRLRVVARAGGYVAARQVVRGASQEVRIAMVAGRRIAGRLIDEAGAPIAGGVVSIKARGTATLAFSGRNGRFELDGAPKQDVELGVKVVGREKLGVDVPLEQSQVGDIEVPGGACFAVHVAGGEGVIESRPRVELREGSDHGNAVPVTARRIDGRTFQVGPVAADGGTYWMRLTTEEGWCESSFRLTGDPDVIQVALTPYAHAEGQLVSAETGLPVADAFVTLVESKPLAGRSERALGEMFLSMTRPTARSDRTGRFRLRLRGNELGADGAARLRIAHPNYRTMSIDVVGFQQIHMAPARRLHVACDPALDHPWRGTLEIRGEAGDRRQVPMASGDETEIQIVDEGPYRATIIVDEGGAWTRSKRFDADSTSQEWRIAPAEEWGRVRGTLIGGESQTVLVRLLVANSDPPVEASLTTTNGVFEFAPVMPGRIIVVGASDQGGTWSATATLRDGQSLELTVPTNE